MTLTHASRCDKRFGCLATERRDGVGPAGQPRILEAHLPTLAQKMIHGEWPRVSSRILRKENPSFGREVWRLLSNDDRAAGAEQQRDLDGRFRP